MCSIILVVVAGLVLTTAVNAQKDSSATDPPREGPAFSSLSVSQCRKIETRWDLHPQNTQNRIEEYVKWVTKVATACAGKVDYYIVGDEVNSNSWKEPIGNGKTRAAS